tara:strand:+ start:2210 stop:3664 length:1455 start_codon:yes stop_codon:yes gene_type:complete
VAKPEVLTNVVDFGDNPYLIGPHEPIRQELDRPDLQCIGEIPKDFSGIYLRNGPNQRFAPYGLHHWFDGDGMIHSAQFKDGEVNYRNKWIKTKALEIELHEGRSIWPGLMDSPDRKLKTNWGSDLWLKDNSNTDISIHAGKAVSTFYQCGDAYTLDPVTLETLGKLDLKSSGARQMSAHCMTDEANGDLLFFDYAVKPPYMSYGVMNKDSELINFTPIELPGARLPHSMAFTPNYSILMDLPMFWDPKLLEQDIHKVTFYPEMQSKFGIIERMATGNTIRWFEADPCYIYHAINSWEEEQEIVLDVCRMSTPVPSKEIRQRLSGPYGAMLAWLKLDACYHRYRFNLETGETKEETLDDLLSEFPVINNRYSGLSSRYSYHVTLAETDVILFDGLVKIDSIEGTRQGYKFPKGNFGSELQFAPRNNSLLEDDGYLITFVTNMISNKGEIQIFPAEDLSKGPLCRLIVPQQIPPGFHSSFVLPENL